MDTLSLRASLLALARNHHWTFTPDVQQTLAGLPGSEPGQHPAATVAGLTEPELDSLLADDAFMEKLRRQSSALSDLTAQIPTAPDVAYYSPEFGITDLVPQYSGGLGVLAGDHLKAASDLGVSLCGVGLFYREGFFRQAVAGGRQTERYERYDAADLGCVDTGVEVELPVGDHDVTARVWRLDVGRIALLLLDTDVAENSRRDRAITDRLYSGDRRHRLEQELILGVGGARAVAALGWASPVSHLNEGHAGFLILELLDREIERGKTLDEALRAIKPGLVFTTHTPVPAGIDRFEPELAATYLAPWADKWGVPVEDVLALGADPSDDPPAFNMAAFCLRAAGRANGVSQLHGQVSRKLFAHVPGGAAIGSVTNGVHARTWVMPRLQHTFDSRLGPGWANGETEAWDRVGEIDDDSIRTIRRAGTVDLQRLVADRTGDAIDPDALVVGFARRFATYKRATLLLQHPAELGELLADDDRPITFVFAGKAHPADGDGKALLAEVVAYGSRPEARGRFIFVPDYDIAVAQAMYAGCDVWLNHPVRPREASGTSGEKSALNGGLYCSISDGWWDEMADGENGWSIASSDDGDDERRDAAESLASLTLFSDEIVPEYYADGAPMSGRWIERVRHNWRTLGPRVTAARMVADYSSNLYEPALTDVHNS